MTFGSGCFDIYLHKRKKKQSQRAYANNNLNVKKMGVLRVFNMGFYGNLKKG